MMGTAVLFCADFDEGAKAPWGWDSNPTFGGGVDALDTMTFVTGPAAFAATTPTNLALGSSIMFATLGKSVSTSANNLVYTFQVNVKQFGGSGGVTREVVPLCGLTVGPQTAAYETFSLALDAKGLELQETVAAADGGQTVQTTPIPGAVAMGAWFRLELAVNRGVSPWTVTVTVDGAQQFQGQSLTQPSDTSIEIDLGILDVPPPAQANAVSFDNVILRGLP